MAYNPQNGALTAKPLSVSTGAPDGGRSYFYDATLYKWRPYQSTAEVLAYLDTPAKRTGHFPIFIHSGTLNTANGTFSGGSVTEYWFKDGINNADLVVKTAPGSSTTLDALTDVTLAGPVLGQTIVYNGSAWVNQTPSTGGATNLDGLTDVQLSSPSTDQVLKWNGTAWVNATSPAGVTELSALSDVNLATPATGQVLKYDGTEWKNATPVTIQSLSGTSPSWNVATYKTAKLTASGNTSITISGATTPDGGVLTFKQDATGSRTLSINGTSLAGRINPAGGSKTLVQWFYDGESYEFDTNYNTGSSATQLSAPTLSATAASSSQINVVVGTVANASNYEVQESTDNTNWTTIGTTAGTYNRTGKTASTQYYYRAKAVGDGTTYSDSAYATANATTQGTGTGSTLNTGLLAYWRMEEATGNRADETGTYPLTSYGDMLSAAGQFGNAANFDRDWNQYLENTSAGLSASGSGWTVAGWFSMDDVYDQCLFSKYTDASNQEFNCYYSTAANKIFLDIFGGSTQYTASLDFSTYNTLVYVVALWDGTSVKLYLNGSATVATTSAPSMNSGTAATFKIGKILNINHMNGKADNVAFWNRALTTAEIDEFKTKSTYPF